MKDCIIQCADIKSSLSVWQLTPVLSHINVFSKKSFPVFYTHCQMEITLWSAQVKLGGGAMNSSYQLPICHSVFSPTHTPTSGGSKCFQIQNFLRFCSMDCLLFLFSFFGFSPVSGFGFSIIYSAKSVTTCPSAFHLTKLVLTFLFCCHLLSYSLCPFGF